MKLKILSWNIWCDCHFNLVSEFIKNADADIIGLQEVMNDDKSRDIISFLKNLGYEYYFSPFLKMPDGREMSNAIFSKYKILKTETYILSPTHSRNAVRADIDINGKVLHFFSTHLRHEHQNPSEVQNLQVDTLIKNLPSENVVVVGDFNAIPESYPIKKMREVLVDTSPESNPTWSMYPEGCPVCNPQKLDTKLDYIFVSKDIKHDSFKVHDSKGSDHLPISIEVNL